MDLETDQLPMLISHGLQNIIYAKLQVKRLTCLYRKNHKRNSTIFRFLFKSRSWGQNNYLYVSIVPIFAAVIGGGSTVWCLILGCVSLALCWWGGSLVLLGDVSLTPFIRVQKFTRNPELLEYTIVNNSYIGFRSGTHEWQCKHYTHNVVSYRRLLHIPCYRTLELENNRHKSISDPSKLMVSHSWVLHWLIIYDWKGNVLSS